MSLHDQPVVAVELVWLLQDRVRNADLSDVVELGDETKDAEFPRRKTAEFSHGEREPQYPAAMLMSSGISLVERDIQPTNGQPARNLVGHGRHPSRLPKL